MTAAPMQMPPAHNSSSHLPVLARLYESLSTRLSPDLARPGSGGVDDLLETVARPLQARLAEVIDRLADIQTELDAASDDGDDGDGLDLDFSFEMTPLPGQAPARTSITRGLTTHAANVCFAACGELRRVQRTLNRLEPSYDGLLAACESARRKMRRSLAAAIEAIAHAAGDEPPIAADRTTELESAIAIRAMYAKFRRELVTCDESDLRSVNRALRYAAVNIAKMVGSPEFAEVRLTDRSLLLSLQGRILRWARDPSGRNGLKLFKDICTAADLLATINMRQELQESDRKVVAEVRAQLIGVANEDEYREALARLANVRGRDDRLDELVDELSLRKISADGWRRLADEVERIASDMARRAASSQFS